MTATDATNRLTLLLANDQEQWCDTACHLLQSQGVRTLTAHSGREALELIESVPVHIAVLDTQMPHLGGMQVVRLMRDMEQAPQAILMARQLTNHLLQEALGMQVFSVLKKPVELNTLLDAIARVLRRRYESRWPD